MTKEQYIESWEEIVNDDLFITDNIELLSKEISTNCWSISVSQEVINELTNEDLLLFLKHVKTNRFKQLSQSKLEIGLIFYTWFDEQVSQLKFNFINSNHVKLPFGAKTYLVQSENEIIQDFLNSNYHDGIPFEKLEKVELDEEDSKNKYVVRVYKEVLNKVKL